MWRWLAGIFLILHGITHVFWPYYGPSTSWLIGDASVLAINIAILGVLAWTQQTVRTGRLATA